MTNARLQQPSTLALILTITTFVFGSLHAAEPGPTDKDAPKKFTKTESGLKYRILRKADGKKPKASDTVTVH
jgi:hypothetical protein